KANTGSLYMDNYRGRLYLKTKGTGSGAGQWQQVLTGSGNSLDMARIKRSAAQSILSGMHQKIYADVKEYDVGGIANVTADHTGSGKITIVKPGKYLVLGHVQVAGIDSGK